MLFRSEALRRTDGGVLDLSYAPRNLWSVDRDGAVPFAVGDLLVLPGRTGLVGLDLETGAQRWRVDELAGQVCAGLERGAVAPAGNEAAASAEPATATTFVCLDGEDPAAITARLVSVDGAIVAETELDPAAESVNLGPEGAVLQAGRDDAGAMVRAIDVRSGETRWEQRLTVRDASQDPRCDQLGDAVPVRLEAGVVGVLGCGLQSFVSADGHLIDEPSGMVQISALGNGSYLRSSSTAVGGPVEAIGPDGAVLWTSEGLVLEGGARDVTAPHLVLLDQGDTLHAVHPDGTSAWSAEVAARQVLVESSQVVLVRSLAHEVVALDVATGVERWRWNTGPAMASEAFPEIVGTFTDGATAVLVVPVGVGESKAVALVLETGEVRWSQDQVGDRPFLEATGGYLLRVEGSEVTVLG